MEFKGPCKGTWQNTHRDYGLWILIILACSVPIGIVAIDHPPLSRYLDRIRDTRPNLSSLSTSHSPKDLPAKRLPISGFWEFFSPGRPQALSTCMESVIGKIAPDGGAAGTCAASHARPRSISDKPICQYVV